MPQSGAETFDNLRLADMKNRRLIVEAGESGMIHQ
jgi:hypothetical protein